MSSDEGKPVKHSEMKNTPLMESSLKEELKECRGATFGSLIGGFMWHSIGAVETNVSEGLKPNGKTRRGGQGGKG